MIAALALSAVWERDIRWLHLTRFVVAFVLTTGFFALNIAIFQPRYLRLFRAILHPRLP